MVADMGEGKKKIPSIIHVVFFKNLKNRIVHPENENFGHHFLTLMVFQTYISNFLSSFENKISF